MSQRDGRRERRQVGMSYANAGRQGRQDNMKILAATDTEPIKKKAGG